MSNHGFDWFTGVATIVADCPATLRSCADLQRFFAGPNEAEWGSTVPRILMHETLHSWQLAGGRWLQRMVHEEWQRAESLRPAQLAPPMGPLRLSYGRPAADAPFSVREIVECLARFWDVHIRGPRTLLVEEEDDLDGRVEELNAIRAREGHGGYSWLEFEALMTEGREHGAYAAPYRWLLEQIKRSMVFNSDNAEPGAAESWAANVVLPIAGFASLNSDDPVATFTAAVGRLLRPDAIGVAATRRHPRFRSISIDWLIVWPVLMPGVVRALTVDVPGSGVSLSLRGKARRA